MEKSNDRDIVLSVVIVSYNCVNFLRFCLNSLYRCSDKRFEVIVVDNNSSDKIEKELPGEFPQARFIFHDFNPGFGTACNAGAEIAKGRYLVMLNPDTVVGEDFTGKIISFMESYPDCGGMGVYMQDGKGKFLKESKRGFPSLFRSFCRFSGVAALFPRSKFFAGYYAAQVNEREVAPVEILSGACMVISCYAYKLTGGFDQRFFMYGEDIDLSWRLIKKGFVNYYNPDISILHFKGESTIKDKKYIYNFFYAMKLFYTIHASNRFNSAFLFNAKLSLVSFFISILSKVAYVKLRFFNFFTKKEFDKSIKQKRSLVIADSRNCIENNPVFKNYNIEKYLSLCDAKCWSEDKFLTQHPFKNRSLIFNVDDYPLSQLLAFINSVAITSYKSNSNRQCAKLFKYKKGSSFESVSYLLPSGNLMFCTSSLSGSTHVVSLTR
ncbi:glycosyltransferase family 2 protein [Marinilabiliaceae bacterium ANBcel2]|nr:glycosyltransferase family 2 protein [Marinilabiliaceae bacterium ANBcel2]